MGFGRSFITMGCLIGCLWACAVQAIELRSGSEAATTIELYTSEGCSSCPSADAWLSELSDDPNIFTRLIPLAFHVDYWNQLGWKDRFSSAQYSRRQREMSAAGLLSQVYTPGFVVNNREWRGWFSRGRSVKPDQLPTTKQPAGVLTVQWPKDSQLMSTSYTPINLKAKGLRLHVAVLGMGLETHVRRGENRGRVLRHDFVVLSHLEYTLSDEGQKTLNKRIAAPNIPDQGQQKSALVVWVSEGDSPAIVQAVAGYL